MYSLLKTANRSPRATWVSTDPVGDLVHAMQNDDRLWALDLETNGLDAASPECAIVGIGLANEYHCLYIDVAGADDLTQRFVKGWLRTVKLTAFNVMFDGTFLQAWVGDWLNWVGDAYALFKQMSGEGFTGQSWSLEAAQRDVLGWTTSNKDALSAALKERGLSKGELWRLPVEVIGPYCASDADAAWQLWEELTAQAAPFPHLLDYHVRVFLNEVRLLAAQQLRGIQVNEERLQTCHRELLASIDSSMNAFLTHTEVAHHIRAYNEEVRAAWIAAEPARHTKAGKESNRWVAWRDREQRHMDDKGFNPNSKQQLGWLFYEKLGYAPRAFTETGRPAIDRKVLPSLGEPGKLLSQYNLYVKRRGYVEAVIEKSRRDGCVHPQFNSVGTVTGRLGGSGGLNLQQMPKTPDFLSALAARPGYKLVQADAEALEPTILAEFSQDKTLLAIYGRDAKPNDIYLYVAAKIPALGREIRKHYDPDRPTPEGIAAAKKYCKRDRSIAKTVQLASSYGAGPHKIQETLALGGIDISLREVREIHRDYWNLFSGVRRFESQLQEMWQTNGGWIPSALGTPICVAEQYLKDINNRFCQTSGHQILQLWIYYATLAFAKRGIEAHPWIVDLHDEQIWEVPEQRADAAAEALAEALRHTNYELGMAIPIKGPATIVDNLAAVKVENYAEWLEQHDDEDAA